MEPTADVSDLTGVTLDINDEVSETPRTSGVVLEPATDTRNDSDMISEPAGTTQGAFGEV